MSQGGKRLLKPKLLDYSKKLVDDVRYLLWIVTVGALVLAFYCVHKGFTGALPWLSAMVGLPWTAWGTVSSFYLNMAKSDHKNGGITMEAARAKNFNIKSKSAMLSNSETENDFGFDELEDMNSTDFSTQQQEYSYIAAQKSDTIPTI